ncbi:sensor histidine kinase [Methanoplanus endosymbiosus]|uniref:histidine kinase n=1 Tax=Methanoplanus endosymbiosus TaxID=33865 RepID=A0A9E7TLR1_9EURY|nr:PAS domain S-box protein [Methanoplanus endosymbiosus]UUX92626.1 PAS domain S-box protein [Methanoplanus endosymbiosus]
MNDDDYPDKDGFLFYNLDISSNAAIFGKAIDLIPNPVFMKDIKGRYTGANREFYRYLGKVPDEIIGKTVFDIAPKELAEVYHRKDRELFDSTGIQRYGGDVRYNDGTVHNVIFNKATFNDENGDVAGIVGVMIDITELEDTKKSLERSERYYRKIFNSANDAFFVHYFNEDGLPGRFIDVNDSACSMLGYSREELLELSVPDLMPEDLYPIIPGVISDLKRDSSVKFVSAFISREGTRIPVEVSSRIFLKNSRKVILSVARDITERKRVEDEIRQSEEKYRTLFESASDAIFILDNDGNFLEANHVACERLGYSREELLGMNKADIDDPALKGEVPARMYELDNKGSVIFETGHLTKSGVIIPVEVHGTVIDYMGSPAVLSIARDISERLKLEEKLRYSEELYRTMFENTGTAMLLIDEDMTIQLANSEIEKISGYKKEDAEGKLKWTEFISSADTERMVNYHTLRRRDPGSAPKNYEATFVRRDGEKVYTTLNISLIPGTEKSIASIQDITDQKLTNLALKENEERLRITIEAANIGTWDWDVASGKVILNDLWYRMLGYKEGDLRPEYSEILRHIHPDDTERVNLAVKECIDGKKLTLNFESRVLSKDKQWIWIMSSGEVVEYDRQNKPLRIAGINQDITEIKRFQNAITETNRKLSILSGITRHDILNQIQAMMYYSYKLMQRGENSPEITEIASKINGITEIIKRQIEFTRDYEGLGIKEPAWQQVGIVADSAASRIDADRINISVSVGSLNVYADLMLGKVFYNIFSNSVNHGRDVTSVKIYFEERGNCGMIIIEDDGTGIPDEKKEKIFEKGFGTNTGLGLFLSKEILAITGMSIVENGEFGKGARFQITIPHQNYQI